MKEKPDVLQGTLALMVLKTLDVLGPQHGYGIARRIEQISGDLLALNQGTLYPLLLKLEHEGSIASQWDASDNNRRARFYRITAAGNIELDEWLRTPPDLSSPPRDELVMKVLIAVRLPGVNVTEVIQSHRRYLVQLMQQWTHLKEDEARFDLSFALVVDAELFRLDSVVRWLDTAEGRLKRASVEPIASKGLPMPLTRRKAEVQP